MISVIVCSRSDAAFEHLSRNYARVLTDEPYEIIRISDATGLAEGYNRGIARARGEVLIFTHDDVELVNADFRQRLLGHLRSYDVLGVAGTRLLVNGLWRGMGPPYVYGQVVEANPDGKSAGLLILSTAARSIGNMMALDGVFLCAKRNVVESIRFDEQTFDRFHLYDVDFTYRAFLAGYKLAVCCDLFLIHGSAGVFGDEWLKYARLFDAKHASTLPRARPRSYQATVVKVFSKSELVELMTPPHWDP